MLNVEGTALESLVHHDAAVDATTPLERVHRTFRERNIDFMAVAKDRRVIGLCARGQIGFLLGSRFGFALNSQSPVETTMVPHPLIVTTRAQLRMVLDDALARHGDEFHEDIVEALRLQNLKLFGANNALRQSQGLYLGLFESHVLGFALLDTAGMIKAHNRRFRGAESLALVSRPLTA